MKYTDRFTPSASSCFSLFDLSASLVRLWTFFGNARHLFMWYHYALGDGIAMVEFIVGFASCGRNSFYLCRYVCRFVGLPVFFGNWNDSSSVLWMSDLMFPRRHKRGSMSLSKSSDHSTEGRYLLTYRCRPESSLEVVVKLDKVDTFAPSQCASGSVGD